MDKMDELIRDLKLKKISPGRYVVCDDKTYFIDASNAMSIFDELGPFGEISFQGILVGIIDFTTFTGFSIVKDEEGVIVVLRAEMIVDKKLPIYMLIKYFRGD